MVACKDAAGGGSARWDVEDSEAMLETGLAALQGILGYSGVPFGFRESFAMLAVGGQPRFTKEARSSDDIVVLPFNLRDLMQPES
jgi:hypothetical protein